MALTEEQTIEMLKEKQQYEFTGKEKEYERHILEHLDDLITCLELPKIKVVESQRRIAFDDFSIRPDIIVRHIDGTLSVFEIKCTNHKHPSTAATHQTNAIGQALLYKTSLEAYTNKKVRVYIIDQKIHYRTYITVKTYSIPITLIEFQKDRIFMPYRNEV